MGWDAVAREMLLCWFRLYVSGVMGALLCCCMQVVLQHVVCLSIFLCVFHSWSGVLVGFQRPSARLADSASYMLASAGYIKCRPWTSVMPDRRFGLAGKCERRMQCSRQGPT